MVPLRRHVLPSFLVLLGAATAPGQAPAVPPQALADLPVRVATAADGTVWAAAGNWKARFAADGASFTPFLGSAEPSHPTTFRLAAATLAGEPLHLGAAPPVCRDARVTFARGDVVETYDLLPEGLEQQFVLRDLPRRGELRLAVAVATDLQAMRDGDGFTFRGAAGGVHCGAAVAVDAAGRRCELDAEWADGALRYTVPAAFIAAAALPLVVDPLLGTVTALATSSAELRATDLAFDQSLGRYAVAYERAYSATDHDVFVARFDAAMTFVDLVTIDFTSAYWAKPRIAVLEGDDAACVVAETSTGNAAPFVVKAVLFGVGQAVPLPNVLALAGGAFSDAVDPDVGGDCGPAAGGRFLVVYTTQGNSVNDSNVEQRRIAADGTMTASTSLGTPIGFDRRPAVSKTCGAPGGGTESWAVVYRHEPYQSSSGQLRISFIDRNGFQRSVGNTTSGPITGTTQNAGSQFDVSSPTDGPLGRTYLCVERRVDPMTGRGALLGHAIDRNGNVLQADGSLASTALDRQNPVVDCDGARFLVAHEAVFSATDHDIRAALFAFVGGQLVQHETTAPTTSGDLEGQPSVCASRSLENTFGLAWVHQAAATWRIEAQRDHGVRAGGLGSRPTGCGSLVATATGSAAIGESFTVQLSTSAGLPGFVFGLPVSAPVGPCPGCTQGASGSTLLGATFVVELPLEPAFVGLTLAVQGFRFAPSGLPCLGQVELSNTIDVQVQ